MSSGYRHPLSPMFEPGSVAVIGGSERPGTVGCAVLRNLRIAGYAGRVFPVNARHDTVGGVPAFRRLADVPERVDLAIVATPARTLEGVVADIVSSGCSNVAILSAGLARLGDEGDRILAAIRTLARAHRVRILGPNSMGLMRPSIGFNASFSEPAVRAGSVALLSQSGGLASAMLDWATTDGIGFSSVVSLGNQCDIGFAEALGYLTEDVRTESILMYVEGVANARAFTSALRAAARIKPVIVLKAGRGPSGARAAVTHTGALAGPDEVFDAVLRRCGAVRVGGFLQLFAAATYLSSRYRPVGRNLAVITNGGGPGVMAVDRATEVGLQIPTLAPATVAALDTALGSHWSRDNPVDLMEDARAAHFAAAVQACLADPAVDGVAAIVTPQTMSEPDRVAGALCAAAQGTGKPVIACMMGDETMRVPLRRLQASRIPAFRSPEPAVEAFATLADFYDNQRLLMQVPGPVPEETAAPDIPRAMAIIARAREGRRDVLFEAETKEVLAAFGVPVASVTVVQSADEAVGAAAAIGYPVALKVQSADIGHKSDVGGVMLGLRDAPSVRAAHAAIVRNVTTARPDARLDGIAVEPMLDRPHGRELLVGVVRDPVFGPVITLGAGGRSVEIYADQAAALPPLNAMLARALIASTRTGRTLEAWRGWPPADCAALERILLRLSALVCEIPDIVALDINPIIVDESGAVAADARMVVSRDTPAGAVRYGHMAICPYPAHLTRRWTLADGSPIVVRPIRPEDAAMEQSFVRGLSEESRYFRFANALHELSERMLVRFTQIDYDRELALVAVVPGEGGDTQIGVARYVIGADDETCEFAVVIGDAWQGKGLGGRLMRCLMDAAAARGLRTMVGYVLAQNTKMLHLMARLGFSVRVDPDDASMRLVSRALQATAPDIAHDPGNVAP